MKQLFFIVFVSLFSLNSFADAEVVVNKACKNCHTINAPRIGHPEEWLPILAKGADTLVATIKSGKGGMPPKGLCMDCSDEDYKAAIEYMAK